MDPIDIQYHIKKNGLTQSALAASIRVSPMTVSKVIHKKLVSDRTMKAIAKAIGFDHVEVFPEYYLAPPARVTSNSEFGVRNNLTVRESQI